MNNSIKRYSIKLNTKNDFEIIELAEKVNKQRLFKFAVLDYKRKSSFIRKNGIVLPEISKSRRLFDANVICVNMIYSFLEWGFDKALINKFLLAYPCENFSFYLKHSHHFVCVFAYFLKNHCKEEEYKSCKWIVNKYYEQYISEFS